MQGAWIPKIASQSKKAAPAPAIVFTFKPPEINAQRKGGKTSTADLYYKGNFLEASRPYFSLHPIGQSLVM